MAAETGHEFARRNAERAGVVGVALEYPRGPIGCLGELALPDQPGQCQHLGLPVVRLQIGRDDGLVCGWSPLISEPIDGGQLQTQAAIVRVDLHRTLVRGNGLDVLLFLNEIVASTDGVRLQNCGIRRLTGNADHQDDDRWNQTTSHRRPQSACRYACIRLAGASAVIIAGS